ncbi:MAG: hypothetical protein H7Y31_13675, partial [Chitinophagaceae bacterium]|nr:hypothetical protein [Chitinophagaceae bacterium]
YKFFHPFSGSVLFSLKKGNIVFTRNTNALEESIEDGVNGFFLTDDIMTDSKRIIQVMNDNDTIKKVRKNSFEAIMQNHFPAVVKDYFNMEVYEVLGSNS